MNEGSNINILDYKELDIENISFHPPKKVKGGSYISEAYYTDTKEKIYIQTPRLTNTTGIVKNDSRSSIELELDQNHYPFFKFVTDLDDHNIINIQKNSMSWFNKDFPLDVVEEFYKTPIKVGRNKSPPKLKLKIPVSKNVITCNIYDNAKNIVDFTSVKKAMKVITIIEFVGLRFLKQQVICEWNPVQIQLCDTITLTPKYLINEDLLTDDESDLVEETNNAQTDTSETNTHVETEEQTIIENPVNLETEVQETPEESETKEVLETPAQEETKEEVLETPVQGETEQEVLETNVQETPEDSETKEVLETPVQTENQNVENNQINLEIQELSENTDLTEAVENIITNEDKNESDIELNLLNNIVEETDTQENYNNLVDIEELLKKTREELELYKRISSEKDEKIAQLKSQFRNFIQNLE